MLGVVIAVGFAAAVPNLGAEKGPLRTEYSIKYGVVPFIFFIMGVALKTKELGKALANMKLNITIQFMSLIVIPAIMYGVYTGLKLTTLNPALNRGLVVLACLPVTTTTCNVLCKAADGNTAVSLFHSALGNLIGAFYTPSVLLLLLGNQSTVSFVDVFVKILETLLCPLIVGQIVHNCFVGNKVVVWVQQKSGDVTKFFLLVIIWNTFCDTFSKKMDNVSTQDFIIVVSIVIASHILYVVMAIGLYSRSFFALNHRTQVSAWFCSTQKTIVMGIPLVKIIFEGNPEIGLIQIPLLMYHPTQTLLASFFLGRINKWVKMDDEEENQNEKTGLLGNGQESSYTALPSSDREDDNLEAGNTSLVSSSQRSYVGESLPASPESIKEQPRVH